MKKFGFVTLLSVGIWLCTPFVMGQSQPATLPFDETASHGNRTQPAAVSPTADPLSDKQSDNVNNLGLKGYVRFSASGREFLARPVDRPWIEMAAKSKAGTVAGATQPSDLFANLESRRDEVLAQMLNDLPTLRPSQIDGLIDDELLPAFRNLAGFRFRPVYLVTAIGPLKVEMQSGWAHPKVRWNRVADRVEFERDIRISASDNDTESLIAAVFEEWRSEQERTALLARFISTSEQQVREALSSRATSTALAKTADFIAREALATLPRREDQVWLPVGLSNVLAAKYISAFHGSPQREFIEALVIGTAGQSINALQVDLLTPLPMDALRAEAIGPYMDARRRKAIAVTYLLVRDAGERSVMPLVNAVERLRPADGLTLAATIKSVCGIDLVAQLRAR